MRLAITADLHWGHRRGQSATTHLAERVRAEPPDLLLLGGDIGTGVHFEDCLGLFGDLDCAKAVVPGNHDIWVPPDETSHDSLDLYERILPEAAARQGFHYLDRSPLFFPEEGLAVVGSINWYDYSWGLEGLTTFFPEELERLHSKRFTRGRHNDAVFVRWPLDDIRFTSLVAGTLERHCEQAIHTGSRLIVVTHHPAIRGLSFPRTRQPRELDEFLWEAFCGNVGVEQILARYAPWINYLFCGHTHRIRESHWEGIAGYNVGSDYPMKRLLWLDWPGGSITVEEFHEDA
ncbi:MAG: metallophosphoesterase [Gemmataceae bacterium]